MPEISEAGSEYATRSAALDAAADDASARARTHVVLEKDGVWKAVPLGLVASMYLDAGWVLRVKVSPPLRNERGVLPLYELATHIPPAETPLDFGTYRQALLDCGLNIFGSTLLAESFLRNPRPMPITFIEPVQRKDCAGWIGVRVVLCPIPDGKEYNDPLASFLSGVRPIENGDVDGNRLVQPCGHDDCQCKYE